MTAKSLAAALTVLYLGAAPPQLRQHTLPDPYLHMTAWTFLAPEGWTLEGGVSWNPRGNPWYTTVLDVRSPGGGQEYRRYPVFMFAQTQNPALANGAEIGPYLDPAQAIEQVLAPRCRPESRQGRVVAVERLPRLAEPVVAEARQYGLPLLRAEAARVLMEYPLNGREREEMFYCTTASFQMRGMVTWMIDRAFSYRAERGRLKEACPVLGTIAASLLENPQWVAARRQAMARRVAAAARPPRTSPSGGPGILDVSRNLAKDQDAFLKGVDTSFSARLDSPGLNAWSDAYRGVHTEHTPAGAAVRVENGYQRYFQDNLGRVYGSNDLLGDPYVNYHMDVHELQP